MTETSEARRRPEDLANNIGGILEEVHDYNEAHFGDVFTQVVRGSQRDHAIEQLVEQGVDRDTAMANADAIEGGDPDTIDRELIDMVHRSTLEAAGLKLGGRNTSLKVLVTDGLRLADALEHPPLGGDGERLVEGLNSLFRSALHDAEYVGLTIPEEDVLSILGPKMSDNWMPHDEAALDPDDVASAQQLTGAALVLADRLVAVGGDEKIATGMRELGQFAQEGNLTPWAFCSEWGLIPATAPENVGNAWWPGWRTPEDWDPLLNVARRVVPGSAFSGYLMESVTAVMSTEEASCRAALDQTFDDYLVAQEAYEEAERARPMSDEDREDMEDDFVSFNINPRSDYDRNQELSRQRLDTYAVVRQRLATALGLADTPPSTSGTGA